MSDEQVLTCENGATREQIDDSDSKIDRYTLGIRGITKKQLQDEIRQSGKSVDEFIGYLLSLHTEQLSKATFTESQKSAIAEVEHHLNRIGQIMAHLLGSARSHIEASELQALNARSELDSVKAELLDVQRKAEKEIAEVKQKAKVTVEAAEEIAAKAQKQALELEEHLHKAREEFKEQQELWMRQLSESRANAAQTNKLLSMTEAALEETRRELENRKTLASEVDKLKETLDTIEKKNRKKTLEADQTQKKLNLAENKICSLKEEHQTALSTLEQRLAQQWSLEKEKAVLETREEERQTHYRLQETIAALREENARLRGDLAVAQASATARSEKG
ncbi:hypothetical protein H1S01_13685 [Heliobacterium chlorum]|uniref:Chromosome partition protein Smc n=1 Tax=Heliobacterium chlorum TaxID=2698 RepID=A0ABR7T459_HELCL|nr:hypothetical protein [Heliobacterium chlorum]MBC9785552.1 hypothetical protein [Heliobacterium chlorum]